MNFFEAHIERLAQVLKRIEGDPDPRRLRSNRVRYRLEVEQAEAQLEAWREVRPFAYFPPHLALPFALGFHWLPLYQGANRRAKEASRLLDVAQSLGLPREGCDTAVMGPAMCMQGELPVPGFLIVHGVCDPTRLGQVLLAHWFGVPYFLLDIPLCRSGESLSYVTDQLSELIETAEARVPGIKYDEDRLKELQEIDRAAYRCYRQIYELLKRVPCPIGLKDAVRNCPLPHEYPRPTKFLDYLKSLRDEIGERADRGAEADEKLRVMWTTAAPAYGNAFAILDRHRVSMPIFYIGPSLYTYGIDTAQYGDTQEYGRALTPIEEEARMLNYDGVAGTGERWIANALLVCRELKLDAIINYNQLGCTATLGLQALLEQRAKEELGIRTLQLYGRFLDGSGADQEGMDSALENFIASCLKRSGARTASG